MGQMHRARAGKLRHPVDLMTLTQTPDGAGGQTEVYVLLASVWASIERATETEKLNAGMQQNVITHNIRIRFCAGLSVSDQVRFGTREFEIMSLEDVEERQYMQQMQCLERSP